MNALSPPSIQGYFWLPESPTIRLPGRFYCADDGTLMLDVLGTFSGKTIEIDSHNLNRILGVSEKGKLLTLKGCLYKNRNFNFPGLATSTVRVNLALIGCHFEQDEPVTFDEITCHSEAFDEWLRFGEINVAWSSNKASIHYTPPKKREWATSIGSTLTLSSSWTAPSMNQVRKARITQKVWVGFRQAEQRPLEELLTLIHRFSDFVSFVVDQTLPIQAICAYSDALVKEVNHVKRCIPIEVYYAPVSRGSIDLSRIAPPFPLFSFQQLSERFAEIISRWFENYETFSSSFNLYFATKSGRDLYLDNRFLMLIQSLEALHRYSSSATAYSADEYRNLCNALQDAIPASFTEWLEPRLKYGNELSLRRRLKALFSGLEALYSNGNTVKEHIARIIDTRNYLTHYDGSLRSRAAKGIDMYKLCIIMETLFQAHMAMLCGFTADEVVEFFHRSELFRRKASEI